MQKEVDVLVAAWNMAREGWLRFGSQQRNRRKTDSGKRVAPIEWMIAESEESSEEQSRTKKSEEEQRSAKKNKGRPKSGIK